MRKLPIVALVALALPSCVTSGDLHEIAGQYEVLAQRMEDPEATPDDVLVAVEQLAEKFRETADVVEDRTSGFIDGIGAAGEGGLIGLLSALGLHMYRNSTRKKELKKIKRQTPQQESAA